jgi:hypothetical protein
VARRKRRSFRMSRHRWRRRRRLGFGYFGNIGHTGPGWTLGMEVGVTPIWVGRLMIWGSGPQGWLVLPAGP